MDFCFQWEKFTVNIVLSSLVWSTWCILLKRKVFADFLIHKQFTQRYLGPTFIRETVEMSMADVGKFYLNGECGTN